MQGSSFLYRSSQLKDLFPAGLDCRQSSVRARWARAEKRTRPM